MSSYARYSLASAGINATEEDIAHIDASGHPDAVVNLLTQFHNEAMREKMQKDHSLPTHDETSLDVPEGYGIEHSHDGYWYAYRVPSVGKVQSYLRDTNGLDRTFTTRGEAIQAAMEESTLSRCHTCFKAVAPGELREIEQNGILGFVRTEVCKDCYRDIRHC